MPVDCNTVGRIRWTWHGYVFLLHRELNVLRLGFSMFSVVTSLQSISDIDLPPSVVTHL